MAARLDQYQQDFEARFAALLAAKREADVDVGIEKKHVWGQYF